MNTETPTSIEMTPANQLVTASQAAEILGISRQWLHIRMQRGEFETITIGKHVFLSLKAIEDYKLRVAHA